MFNRFISRLIDRATPPEDPRDDRAQRFVMAYPPTLHGSRRIQREDTEAKFAQWWEEYLTNPWASLRGPRKPLAAQAYAAGAESVYALAESMGIVITPAHPAPSAEAPEV